MQEIKEILKEAIKTLYSLDFEPEITLSPENIDADYSSNAPLKLAKELHKPPMEIAADIETFISRRRGVRSAAARGLAPAAHGDGSAGRAPRRRNLGPDRIIIP